MIASLGGTIRHGDPGLIPGQFIGAYNVMTGTGKCIDQCTAGFPFIIHLP